MSSNLKIVSIYFWVAVIMYKKNFGLQRKMTILVISLWSLQNFASAFRIPKAFVTFRNCLQNSIISHLWNTLDGCQKWLIQMTSILFLVCSMLLVSGDDRKTRRAMCGTSPWPLIFLYQNPLVVHPLLQSSPLHCPCTWKLAIASSKDHHKSRNIKPRLNNYSLFFQIFLSLPTVTVTLAWVFFPWFFFSFESLEKNK